MDENAKALKHGGKGVNGEIKDKKPNASATSVPLCSKVFITFARPLQG